MLLGRNVHRLVHAGQADGFILRHLLHTRLRLHAHRPAGRMQLNTRFLVWLVRLAGFAVCEQADPALDGAKPIPLRRKSNTLSGRDAAGIATDKNRSDRRGGCNKRWRQQLHVRLAAGSCSAMPITGATAALARRHHHFYTVQTPPCPRCAQRSRTSRLRAVSAQRKPGRSRAPVILFTRHANVSRAECLVTSGSRYAVFSGPQIEREIIFFPSFGRIALNCAHYIEIVFLRF